MLVLGLLISVCGGFITLKNTSNILEIDAGGFYLMLIGAIVASGLILSGIIFLALGGKK